MEPDNLVSINAASGTAIGGSKRSRKKHKSETASESTQPKKRMKGKGKVGKLEGLMLLPMDVLFEVCLHMPSPIRRQLLTVNIC